MDFRFITCFHLGVVVSIVVYKYMYLGSNPWPEQTAQYLPICPWVVKLVYTW